MPLLCDFFIEEFERENKDLDLPTYIGFVNDKSAFDVVVHANLIRRLFQIGISKQSILMINSLYQNAVSCIKWNNHMSNTIFKIEQEFRQAGALSADLYKVYINHLFYILSSTGLGGKIGNINCCAPTCADDVALTANNPLDIQTMVDTSVDFSKREGYLLQLMKSAVLPVKTTTKTKILQINEGYWKLDGKDMPVMENTSHIGIQKSGNNSVQLTVDENITKSSRGM